MRAKAGGPGDEVPSLEVYRRIALRLIAELAVIAQAIPVQRQSVSALANWTGVNRPVCHRFFSAARFEGEALDVFAALPGRDGLADVLRAISVRVKQPVVSAARETALRLYVQAIGLAGGSQAKLVRRVEALRHAARETSDPDVARREAGFESAARITGFQADATVLTQFGRIALVDGVRKVENVALVAHLGLRARPGHLPFIQTFGTSRAPPGGIRHTLRRSRTTGANPLALIEPFSSSPPPEVVSRTVDGHLRDIVDLTPATVGPIDLVLGTTMVGDLTDAPLRFNALSRVPARELLVDVFIDREMSVGKSVEAGAFFIGSGGLIQGALSERWFDLVHPVSAQLVEPVEPDAISHAAYARYAELIGYVLAEMGWPLDAFRRVRMHVPYPVWGCAYAFRSTSQPPSRPAD